jgi:hypothetical protein
MATATVQSLTSALKKLKLLHITDPKLLDGHFLAPKSATGKEFVILLPESYSKKDRGPFLQNVLGVALKDLKAKYDPRSTKSTAGALTFTGSQIYIIAKLMSAKGGGGNKGIDFEKNLEKDFNLLIAEKTNYFYKDFINAFVDEIAPDKVKKIEAVGGLNTPRPLALSGDKLYVSVRGGPRREDIGDGLADLVVHTSKNKKIPLSLKYGSTVTFFNSGVGKIFNEEAFKKGDFTQSPVANKLIELLHLDPIRFRNVFMNYKAKDPLAKKGKAEKHEVVVNLTQEQKNDLQSFLRTVIGHGYVLVHEHSDHSVSHYNITPDFLKKATKITTPLTVQYPVGGSAKRVDIRLETEIFKLNFNIRNKQGGILPSHIMCDYKIKDH